MYDDILTQAIKRRFAPNFCDAMRDATTMDFVGKRASVNLPLRADVEVVYEKDLAAFIVTGTILDRDKDKWFGGKQLFSTREFAGAKDKAAMIEYLFDESKKQFLRALADGELDSILNPNIKDQKFKVK